ncbi:hypothetical protein [Polaromonas sp. CG9_12]|nr:hypothetical protein [Polaromonas sp. CG9_12]
MTTTEALFAAMYEAHIKCGRPGIAPEKLLRAMLFAKCSEASARNASKVVGSKLVSCELGLKTS